MHENKSKEYQKPALEEREIDAETKERLLNLPDRRTVSPLVRVSDIFPQINEENLPLVEDKESRGYEREESTPTEFAKYLLRDMQMHFSGSKREGHGFYTMEYEKEKGKIYEKVRERFKDQIVVDIAAGNKPYGLRIAEFAGAKACIEIEKYQAGYLQESILKNGILEVLENKDKHKPIPVAVVAEDVLTFLRRLPDASVSLFSCGAELIGYDDYKKAVKKEIARVLHPLGAYFEGQNSGLWRRVGEDDSEEFDDEGDREAKIITRKDKPE